jgi:hypothetical protein
VIRYRILTWNKPRNPFFGPNCRFVNFQAAGKRLSPQKVHIPSVWFDGLNRAIQSFRLAQDRSETRKSADVCPEIDDLIDLAQGAPHQFYWIILKGVRESVDVAFAESDVEPNETRHDSQSNPVKDRGQTIKTPWPEPAKTVNPKTSQRHGSSADMIQRHGRCAQCPLFANPT